MSNHEKTFRNCKQVFTTLQRVFQYSLGYGFGWEIPKVFADRMAVDETFFV